MANAAAGADADPDTDAGAGAVELGKAAGFSGIRNVIGGRWGVGVGTGVGSTDAPADGPEAGAPSPSATGGRTTFSVFFLNQSAMRTSRIVARA